MIEEEPVLVKEECVSSDDDDDDDGDAAVPCGSAFLCEICALADDESHAVFKERNDLVLHTFKNHSSACIGCFENFHTQDDLTKHVMVDSHGLPFCRECWRLFPEQSLLIHHPCQTASTNEVSGDESMDTEESEDDGPTVKTEPQSEGEESEFVYSIEKGSNGESESERPQEDCSLSCIHCTAEDFKSQHDLRVHTCKAHPSVCVVCFEGFDDETSLHNHQKALNHTVWKCEKCDKYFMRRTMYRVHLTVHHPEECRYQCADCNWRGCSKAHLANHRRQAHFNARRARVIKLNWRIYSNRCNICLKSYLTGYSLLLHMFKEHNEPGQTHVYKCELCQLGFGQARAFELHLKENHSDDTDYLSEVKALVESSLAKSLNCEGCGEKHPNETRLRKHMLTKHPELRPHKCNICEARFPEEGDLRIHVWCQHEGPLAIVCPLCDFSTTACRFLEVHLKKDHGYKGMPYMYCFAHGKKYSRYREYRKHFEWEHLNRPANRPVRPPAPTTGFPCHLCPKEFGSSHNCKIHVGKVHLHSGERVKCRMTKTYVPMETALKMSEGQPWQ